MPHMTRNGTWERLYSTSALVMKVGIPETLEFHSKKTQLRMV
jgi:hypothetical protein